jgi:hypothetical protein
MPDTRDLQRESDPEAELERQVGVLLAKGYPALAGLDERSFTSLVDPLRELLPKASASSETAIPFLLVVTSALVPTASAVERFEVGGRAGWTDMQDELADYRPIPGVEVPESPVYLVVDVETGADTLDVRPDDALPVITGRGRTPITVDEGVALVTQFPEVFTARNAFQALASRASNKRIPSFWVSKGAPRLGWCWAGNPHTWLGAASAGARLDPGPLPAQPGRA